MSFLNIKNQKERDAVIEEYLAVKEKIKNNDRAERGNLIERQRYLKREYEPVVESNKKMTEKITNRLIPIQKELNDLAVKLTPNKIGVSDVENTEGVTIQSKRLVKREVSDADNIEGVRMHSKRGVKREVSDVENTEGAEVYKVEEHKFGPLATKFLNMWMNEDARKRKIDSVFGIRKTDDSWKIGNKRVTIDVEDNLVVGDETYEGTAGFWSLVTEKNPRNYTSDDLDRYKELLHETSALHQDYDPLSSYPRASKSNKWKRVLAPIWNEFRKTGVVEDYDAITDVDDNADGDGIKMYLRKSGKCYNLKKTKDGGMHISSRPKLTSVYADGLYLRRANSNIHRGEGLILGENSPFKNIPLLGLIL